MSKWRPSLSGCLYVIPDLHGSINILNRILARILPLRKNDGVQDKIVFLGDYIDRHDSSHLVLDKMVELKNKYGDNIITLIGNHELLFLEALDLTKTFGYNDIGTKKAYETWMLNGGIKTLFGYLGRCNSNTSPYHFPQHRIIDIIPESHIEFLLKQLLPYYETEDFIFTHAGMDLGKPVHENDLHTLTWDRDLFNAMSITNNTQHKPPELEKCLVTGHSHRGPVICHNYMMLDCGAPKRVLLCELNSMEAFMVHDNKARMISFDLKETHKVESPFNGSFRRV